MNKKIAITLGDPSGISYEIALKAIDRGILNKKSIIFIGTLKLFLKEAKKLNINLKSSLFEFIDISNEDINLVKKGKVSKEAGMLSYNYIKEALNLYKKNEINALITLPITKASFIKANIPFLDHTQILEAFFKKRLTTILQNKHFKVSHILRHISFKEILKNLTIDKIIKEIKITNTNFKTTYKKNPKIYIPALNPHASDFSTIGDEEDKIISKAINKAKLKRYKVYGPYPADIVFYKAYKDKIDLVLALYHDQGHIAIKGINPFETISITAGSDLLRVSPDHGSALDIAKKYIASEKSLILAYKELLQILKYR